MSAPATTSPSSSSSSWKDVVLWDPQFEQEIDLLELVQEVEETQTYKDRYPTGFPVWTFNDLEKIATKKQDLDHRQARVLSYQYAMAMEKAIAEGWVHELLGEFEGELVVGRQVLSKAQAEEILRRKGAKGYAKRFVESRHWSHKIELELYTNKYGEPTGSVLRLVGHRQTGDRFRITAIKMLNKGHFTPNSNVNTGTSTSTTNQPAKAKAAVTSTATAPVFTAVTPSPVVARKSMTGINNKRPSSTMDTGAPARKKTMVAVKSAGVVTAAAAAAAFPARGRGGTVVLRDVGRRNYSERDDQDDEDASAYGDHDDEYDDEGAHEPRGMKIVGAPRWAMQEQQHQQQHEHHLLQRLVQQQALHIRQQGRQIEQLLQQVQQLQQQQQQNPGFVQRLRAWLLQEGEY